MQKLVPLVLTIASLIERWHLTLSVTTRKKNKKRSSSNNAPPVFHCLKCSRDFRNSCQLNTHVAKCKRTMNRDWKNDGLSILSVALLSAQQLHLLGSFAPRLLRKRLENDVTPEISSHKLSQGILFLEQFHSISFSPINKVGEPFGLTASNDSTIQNVELKNHDYEARCKTKGPKMENPR